MQKDLKIGMVLGLVLVPIAIIWLSTRPSLSTKARMLHLHNSGALQETHSSPNNLLTNELTVETSSPTHQQNTKKTENNQLSTINNQSKLPDFTIHYKSEKIKTQKFHIVRKGETLSDISYKYYGSTNKWQKILDANRNVIKDANRLRPGVKLIIPE